MWVEGGRPWLSNFSARLKPKPGRNREMTPEQIDEAARALIAARKGQPIAALPDDLRPQSEAVRIHTVGRPEP